MVDRPPQPRPVKLPVQFRADGANWYVQSKHYRVCLARSGGGELRGLWTARGEQPIIEHARTYTDYGILADSTDSLGRKSRTTGSTEQDLEPDCWIEPGEGELRLRFCGYMRQAHRWRNIVSPRVQYETVWHFDGSPRIKVEHRARPLIAPQPQCKAFLAQVFSVPETQAWQATAGGRGYSGGADQDPSGRVLQSKLIGATVDNMELTTARGKVRLEHLRGWGETPQNVFLLRSADSPTYTMFLAMLDGQPVDLDARWRGYAYDLVVRGR